MTFEGYKILSLSLHYIITLTPTIYICYKVRNDIVKLISAFYIILFLWGITCQLFQGCPITYIENYFSNYFLGKPFYPNYRFEGSVFYLISQDFIFYIPAIVLIIIKTLTHHVRNNRNG